MISVNTNTQNGLPSNHLPLLAHAPAFKPHAIIPAVTVPSTSTPESTKQRRKKCILNILYALSIRRFVRFTS